MNGEFISVQPSDTNGASCDANSTSCAIYVSSQCTSDCGGRTYHCPSANTCGTCTFRCGGQERACENTKLFTYQCQYVLIWGTIADAPRLHKNMTIHGPICGTL